jgi:hypothetical protein
MAVFRPGMSSQSTAGGHFATQKHIGIEIAANSDPNPANS